MIPVAILAGGMGTRLLPVTRFIPKAMVLIDGMPFVGYQLASLAAQGFRQVVICTGHLGGQIEKAVGNGCHYGLNVAYSYDGPEALGTGGAIANALDMLGPVFGVLYGDTYPLYDLARICRTHRNAITMAVRTPGQGNVDYANGKVRLYSSRKGLSHGDAGFSVFDADAFECWQEAFELSDLYGALSQEGCIDGYIVTDPVYEVGSFNGLAAFTEYVNTR